MTKHYHTILLDIDNTITRLQPTLDLMARVFRRVPKLEEEITSFRLSEAYHVSRAKELDFWQTYETEICQHSQVSATRLEYILENYTTKDTVVYIMTSRDQKYYDDTYDWLVKNGLRFNQLFCVGKSSKVKLLEELKVEAVFEDNPDFFYELWDEGLYTRIDTYCIDHPYNQHIPTKYRLHRDTGEHLPVGEMASDTLASYK